MLAMLSITFRADLRHPLVNLWRYVLGNPDPVNDLHHDIPGGLVFDPRACVIMCALQVHKRLELWGGVPCSNQIKSSWENHPLPVPVKGRSTRTI